MNKKEKDTKYDKCYKTLNQYYDRSVSKIMKSNHKVYEIFEQYSFEIWGEKCFKRLVTRYKIKKTDIVYDECYEAAMLAYIYSCCRCSLKEDYEQFFEAYLYKMMKIYFICSFTIVKHNENIAKTNDLKMMNVSPETGYYL